MTKNKNLFGKEKIIFLEIFVVETGVTSTKRDKIYSVSVTQIIVFSMFRFTDKRSFVQKTKIFCQKTNLTILK